MMIDILKKIRSHRSFTKKKISMEELEKMLEATRYAASTKNSQKLRYVLINSNELCEKIFPMVKFAGAISWNPTIEEAPTAYILICSENPLTDISEKNLYFDMGIASQNILLIANELGYGGCIIGSYNKPKIEKLIELPKNYISHMLISLGESKDTVSIIEAIDNNLIYSRDSNNHHFVPKLPLSKISLLKK